MCKIKSSKNYDYKERKEHKMSNYYIKMSFYFSASFLNLLIKIK